MPTDKADITDAGPRLKAMNDALEASDRLQAEIARLQAENELLRGYRDEAEAEASIASLAAQSLRLTDAERWLLEMLADHPVTHQIMPHEVATLRGLLERLSPKSDRPKPIATPATPAECTVPPEWTSKPFWVDPPSGWAYGFPRLYDPAKDGDLTEWMIANGYPEKLARQGLACTFTACTEDGEK